jgi:G3E family GTPase
MIPVNLLTGFLGAGKTTLLSRLLRDPSLARVAVLINEFGEVGLDHHLLERIDETTVLLASGCICCTVRTDLSRAIRDLLSRGARGELPPFDRIVIESTGLADPFPVLSTLRADPVLTHHVVPGTVVTVVDALNATEQLPRHPESVRQVAAADRLVLTKTDLVSPAATHALAARLAALNPLAELRHAHAADCTASWLTAAPDTPGRRRARLAPADDPLTERSAPALSFTLTLDQPIDWTMFGIWLTLLLHHHGSDVLRVKGILAVAGEERPVAIHGVQHLVYPPVHLSRWASDDRRSHIVFITTGIPAASIRASLDSFLRLAATTP